VGYHLRTLIMQFEKAEPNMPTVNTISIYRTRGAPGLYVFHTGKIT